MRDQLFEIIDLEQNTPEWLAFRRGHVGASDTPIIMGASPWSSALQLYNRKQMLAPEQASHRGMRRGQALEATARQIAENTLNISFIPMVIKSLIHHPMIASLDGISSDYKTLLEVKCPNAEVMDLASMGQIPHYYYLQMQHQLLLTGANVCYYMAYDGKRDYLIPVLPDAICQDNIVRAALDFHRCLLTNTPPALGESDHLEIEDARLAELAREYASVKREMDLLKKREKTLKDELVSASDDGNFIITDNGKTVLKATRVNRKGNMQWDKLWKDACELHHDLSETDLEQYRAESIGFWTLTPSEA